ncbi:MAG TPA: hypothetical protein VFM60_03775 [Salinimicrobium sp.]|nr:hypothetical protein [Salinimicrobium sp.]
MKTLIIFLLSIGMVSLGQAQQFVRLEKVSLENSSNSLRVDPKSNKVTFTIDESSVSLFEKDPLQFIEASFDIDAFIAENSESEFDSYKVTFKSNKGILTANYNSEGEMLSLYQRVRDVYVPFFTMNQIFNEYRDWDLVGNKYVALTRKGVVKKEFYKVKLSQGNRNKTIRIDIEPFQSKFASVL